MSSHAPQDKARIRRMAATHAAPATVVLFIRDNMLNNDMTRSRIRKDSQAGISEESVLAPGVDVDLEVLPLLQLVQHLLSPECESRGKESVVVA